MPTPITPFIVYGTVSNENSALIASVNVTAHNTTKSTRITAVTNSSGQYALDLANLAIDLGYESGDSITMYVRHNGYVGESTFTVSGENRNVNLSVANQVTLATIRNTLWKAIYDTIKSTSFAISTTSIYSAMNDQLVSSTGYPLVIMYPPIVTKDGISMDNTVVESEVEIMFEIFHTSAANVKVLADNVENQLWRAQEVWTGLGMGSIEMSDSSYDWFTEGDKKIHTISFSMRAPFYGTVILP